MKAKLQMIALVFAFFVIAWQIPQAVSGQGSTTGFRVFYDELSPYGTWVRSHDYGYVWIPDVDPGFIPYSTNGYWVFTIEGWTWVSDYAWGWAPFHYGRWYVDPNWGNIWVPDYEWGPGWVTWRQSGEFYGWAPIGPGVTINVAYGSRYMVPYNQWTFVRNRDFGRTNIHRYYVSTTYNITIINNSKVINNTRVDRTRNVTYNAGPDRIEVERKAGKRFAPVTIRDYNKPGQKMSNDQLHIYRPMVHRENVNQRPSAPTRVAEYKNLNAVPERGIRPKEVKPDQPARTQPSQQQRKEQPAKQQTVKQQPSQQSQTHPTRNVEREKKSPDDKPPKSK